MRSRDVIVQEVRAKLDREGLPWLPMPRWKTKLSLPEWVEYRERRGRHHERFPKYPVGWHRPDPATASAVWNLLAHSLGIQPTEFLPEHPAPEDLSAEDYDEMTVTAKQALLVVLDTVVAAGRQQSGGLFNCVFDALAERWSDHFRDAGKRGAFTAYNMTEETVRASHRDLLRNGIRLDVLWNLAVAKTDDRNPLYRVERVPYGSYKIRVNEGSAMLEEFETRVQGEKHYRRPWHGPRLLLEEDPAAERPPQSEICAEHAFNVVELGDKSKRLLDLQESTRLLFRVGVFRHDYDEMVQAAEAIRQELDQRGIDARLSNQAKVAWRAGKKVDVPSPRAFSVWQAIPKTCEGYEAERRHVWERLGEYDRLASITESVRAVSERIGALPPGGLLDFSDEFEGNIGDYYRTIKSGFYRLVNRRYQPAHFWPVNVSKEMRKRWFRVYTPPPVLVIDELDAPPSEVLGEPSLELVDVDVSSSQTQILAVLLGLDELEEKARSLKPKFKEYLAQRAWQMHEESKDLLTDGYASTGEGYERLVQFVKELWMRTLYGSEPQEVIYNLAMEPSVYGHGWKTKAGMWEPGWIKEATTKATTFLTSFTWYEEVKKFLKACRQLADKAWRDNKYQGVVLTDPFDRARVVWNPIHRANKAVTFGPLHVYVSLPGRLVKPPSGARPRFRPTKRDPDSGKYVVDRGELKRMVAPCLVQMLDAYFSSLMIERLVEQGVDNVVGIHDCWHVPVLFQAEEGGPLLSGREALDRATREAGAAWLEGLGPVYHDLIRYLGDTQDGTWFRALKAKWKARVDRRDWPRFAAV